MTRMARLTASTLLAAAVSPALAQDAVKRPAAIVDGAPIRSEPLPFPPTVSGSATASDPGPLDNLGTCGTASRPVQWLPWWKRWKTSLRNCFGYESEFEAVPLGAFVDEAYRIHVANGQAARMVLYHYDFVGNTAALNTHGQDHLAKIAAMLAHNSFPVIVERTSSNPALAQARRLAVLNQLGGEGIVIPPERVVVGGPIANGLRGAEAEIIYQNLLSQTRERGLVTGGASGFAGAATSPPGGTGGGTGSPQPPP